jgi:methyl-accepting chemotaxis protein
MTLKYFFAALLTAITAGVTSPSYACCSNNNSSSKIDQLQALLNSELLVSKTVSDTIAVYISTVGYGKREDTLKFLKQIQISHPEYIGTATIWEKEKNDLKLIKIPGTNPKDGRFAPYWNLLSGKLTLDPITEDVEMAPYYNVPKKTKQFQLVEPYIYDGKLMTSFESPIVINNQFKGTGSVDLTFDAWNKKVREMGQFIVLSAENNYVVAPKDSDLGQKSMLSSPQDGQSALSPYDNQSHRIQVRPLALGKWQLVEFL